MSDPINDDENDAVDDLFLDEDNDVVYDVLIDVDVVDDDNDD